MKTKFLKYNINMIELKNGFVNKVYRDGNKTIVKKNSDGFNHKINYNSLSEFDFSPKVIKDTKEELIKEFIEGEEVTKATDDDLIQIAKNMRKIHVSELKFPKNNLRARVRAYLNIVHDKHSHIPEIEDNWKKMNSLITKMNNINPCHNDIHPGNLIKDKDNKIWLLDWEYSTMGDKHFDLAFYIESSYIDKDQEKVFLDAYNSTDTYQTYIPQWMHNYKLFVNWLTLIWAKAQDKEPFPLDRIIKRINELSKK